MTTLGILEESLDDDDEARDVTGEGERDRRSGDMELSLKLTRRGVGEGERGVGRNRRGTGGNSIGPGGSYSALSLRAKSSSLSSSPSGAARNASA